MKKKGYTEILNYIYESAIKIRILRYLAGSSEYNRYSCRDIAKALKISPSTASLILTSLEYLNIVKKDIISKTHLYCYNNESYIVQDIILPGFYKERKLNDTAGQYAVSIIKKESISVVMYGSSVNGTDTTDSDYDMCVIVENQKTKNSVEKKLNDIAHNFSLKFGKPLSPYILTLSEFKHRFKDKAGIVIEIIKTGKLLYGKRLQTLALKKD